MTSSPRQAGYTLAEMLAALLIVSLGFGGALEAGQLVERQQRAAVKTVREPDVGRGSERRLSALLAAYRPSGIAEQDLQGGPTSFRFPCGEGFCGARLQSTADADQLRLEGPTAEVLSLGHSRHLHFLYVSQAGENELWPDPQAKPTPLKAVLLVEGAGSEATAILTARVWRSEPVGCRFDVVARACRVATP